MKLRAFFLVASLLVSRAAFADDNAAAAEDLFQRAKALMVKKQYNDACPMFAESYRLDPAGGTLQNLAVCLESNGKWASAYARFQELRAVSQQATPPRNDRIKLADDHIAKVSGKISHLMLEVPADLAASVTVQIDTATFQRPSWAAGVAVDPGSHDVVVTAKGKEPWSTTVTIPSEATEQKVPVPELVDVPVVAQPVQPGIADERHSDEDRARLESERRMRRTGYFVGGAGIAVLATGLVFGGLAIKNNNDAKNMCNRGVGGGGENGDIDPAGHCYNQSTTLRESNQTTSRARTFANVSNVLVPVGAVGLGVGMFFAFILPRTTAELRVGPTVGGGALEGVF